MFSPFLGPIQKDWCNVTIPHHEENESIPNAQAVRCLSQVQNPSLCSDPRYLNIKTDIGGNMLSVRKKTLLTPSHIAQLTKNHNFGLIYAHIHSKLYKN